MQSEIETSPSLSAQSEMASSLSAIDFKTALDQLLRGAFHQFLIRNIEDETEKSETIARIPEILSEHDIFDRIHALLAYMNDVQLQQYREEIFTLLSEKNPFFHALTTGSQELDEAFEILSIEMRKFLNGKGIQAVMPFQFHGKIQRRLDSLARILIPSVRFTVCLAVTIVGNKLFISANLDSSLTQLCANHIWNRLSLFRAFFTGLPREYYQAETFEEHQTIFVEKIREFLPLLLAQGGHGVSQELIIQAVQKMVFACASPMPDEAHENVERDNFTFTEFFAIIENPEVKLLIPKKIEGEESLRAKNLCYAEFTTRALGAASEKISVTERIHLIGKFNSNLSIRYIHCEQLLLYYFDSIKGSLSPRSHVDVQLLRIGISKLCCQTCIIAIDEWNHRQRKGQMQVAVRGWHEKTYHQVLNLFNPQAFSAPSPQKISPISEEAESAEMHPYLRGASEISFHKPLDRGDVAASSTPPKRVADCMESAAVLDGLSTPKRISKRNGDGEGEYLARELSCAKAIVSPNSPYEGRVSFRALVIEQNPHMLPFSLAKIGEMNGAEENLEKNSKSC